MLTFSSVKEVKVMSNYTKAISEEAELICTAMHLILFSTEEIEENGMKIIQVLVDKENREEVTIDEITKVIEILQKVVEVKDLIPDEYFLEVSSVGIERPLRTLEDIKNSIGEYIYIEVKEPVEKKNDWYGTLEKVENNIITMKINCKGKLKKIDVPYENVSFARIAIKF